MSYVYPQHIHISAYITTQSKAQTTRIYSFYARNTQHANMILAVPTSKVIVVLAAVMLGLTLSGSPLTEASPVTTDDGGVRTRCADILAESIQLICRNRTRSLADAYPNSFGRRNKRLSPDEIFYRPLQNGPTHDCCSRPCNYTELKQYCAPPESEN
ncbi:probable insulin-like peptide 6 [Drosophila pseudoobscura]|nr:probable insulin-like peptide 6 [Drosophila pseudoobscura]